MDNLLLSVFAGFLYLAVGILLFIASLFIFEYWTPFDVRAGIFKTQNKALWLIVRGQLIAQGIIISSAVFFTGYTPDKWFLTIDVFLPAILTTFGFWLLGMLMLQFCLSMTMKLFSIEKEIIIDHNESLGMIIEAFLIATSLLISIAFYSY